MILLSDAQHKGNAVKIQLKPISFPVIEEDHVETAEERKISQLNKLSNQISAAEKEFEKINNEIVEQQLTAKQELEAAKEQWLTEKEHLIETTKQAAFTEGFKEGQEQGLQSLEQQLTQADQIVETARVEYSKILSQKDATILELSTKIASKIINREIDENDAFLDLVKAAIQEVHDQPSIKVYTSADDYQLITDQHDQLLTLLDPEIVLTIHPLATLEKGDCIIRTPYSKLDVSVDKQLTKIKTRLFEVMEEIKREHR